MDVSEIAKMIEKDTGSSGAVALRMAGRITGLHRDLSGAVAAYLEGAPVSFAFGSVTLQTIMDKEHCSVVEALFSMSALLENPELAGRYESLVLRRDNVQG